ncbi:SH3 domain-containing protein, partial [Nitratireductor sp. GCM10026969]|uniref:SH3 domain-containing protein n=1 Tax=Nitratireductor sp. GCM10026969 TaxID=3252645 RepID=UPI003620DCCB
MKHSNLKAATAAVALFAFTGVAAAQMSATATTDLNIRSGPGPQHNVIGVIGANEQATINGCLEGSKWCQVTHAGTEGWAYSDYLTASVAGQEQIILSERPAQAEIPTVTYETTASTDDGSGALAGGATGAVAGALIGGP